MDTSCLGAGGAITPARGLWGLSHPLPSGRLPIPDFGRVGQGPLLPGVYQEGQGPLGPLIPGVCQEGQGPLGMGASSTPRFRTPTSGGAMRFAGLGPLLRRVNRPLRSRARGYLPLPWIRLVN